MAGCVSIYLVIFSAILLSRSSWHRAQMCVSSSSGCASTRLLRRPQSPQTCRAENNLLQAKASKITITKTESTIWSGVPKKYANNVSIESPVVKIVVGNRSKFIIPKFSYLSTRRVGYGENPTLFCIIESHNEKDRNEHDDRQDKKDLAQGNEMEFHEE